MLYFAGGTLLATRFVIGPTTLWGWMERNRSQPGDFCCGRFGDATNTADRDGGAKLWLDRNEVEFRMGVAAKLYFCCFSKAGQAAQSVRPAKNQNRILFRSDTLHSLFIDRKTAKASQPRPSELTTISVKATASPRRPCPLCSSPPRNCVLETTG